MAAAPPSTDRRSVSPARHTAGRNHHRFTRPLRIWRAAALTTAAGLTLASCGSGAGSGASTASSQREKSGFTHYPVDKRPAAPAISGKLVGGGTLDLADWRGEVVVINVWGSWCAPCRAEAPALRKISDATGKLGVRFVGFNTRDNDSAATAFERNYKIAYPSLRDRDGRLVLRFDGLVPVSAVPSTVLIDRSGHIAVRIIGPTSYGTLNTVVRELAAERPDKGAGA
ncbi:TlpA family protein disulfide reductase [Streptomyces sp. NPDC017230]|uniref:TlpA family protein disulfide reductase n=1 Tax=unclassified Streptomyces TaxID=2593676 RepID=UPI0037B65FFD